ncbi:hypothetical protein DFH09DRAFT_1082145 [Mycena vulgaris]|nr:hypothetical protein DFH09DRAFT_1082145 [Mycena vulgaris]
MSCALQKLSARTEGAKGDDKGAWSTDAPNLRAAGLAGSRHVVNAGGERERGGYRKRGRTGGPSRRRGNGLVKIRDAGDAPAAVPHRASALVGGPVLERLGAGRVGDVGAAGLSGAEERSRAAAAHAALKDIKYVIKGESGGMPGGLTGASIDAACGPMQLQDARERDAGQTVPPPCSVRVLTVTVTSLFATIKLNPSKVIPCTQDWSVRSCSVESIHPSVDGIHRSIWDINGLSAFSARDPHRTVYGYDRKLYGRKCGPTGLNRNRKELSEALTVTRALRDGYGDRQTVTVHRNYGYGGDPYSLPPNVPKIQAVGVARLKVPRWCIEA